MMETALCLRFLHAHSSRLCAANQAAAALAAGAPSAALAAASAASSARPRWHKALFRRAEALVALRRFREAAADFEAALECVPEGDDDTRATIRRDTPSSPADALFCVLSRAWRAWFPRGCTNKQLPIAAAVHKKAGTIQNKCRLAIRLKSLRPCCLNPVRSARLEAARAAAESADALRAAEADIADTSPTDNPGAPSAPATEAAADPSTADEHGGPAASGAAQLVQLAEARERDPRVTVLLQRAQQAAAAGDAEAAGRHCRAALGLDPECHQARHGATIYTMSSRFPNEERALALSSAPRSPCLQSPPWVQRVTGCHFVSQAAYLAGRVEAARGDWEEAAALFAAARRAEVRRRNLLPTRTHPAHPQPTPAHPRTPYPSMIGALPKTPPRAAAGFPSGVRCLRGRPHAPRPPCGG